MNDIYSNKVIYMALSKVIFILMTLFNKYSANDLDSMDSFGKLLNTIFIAVACQQLEV